MRSSKVFLAALVLIGVALIATISSQDAAADPRTWDNENSDNDWFNPLNWDPDGGPDSLDDLIVKFGTPATATNVTSDDGGSISIDGAGTVVAFLGIKVGDNTVGTLTITGGGKLTDTKGWLGYTAASSVGWATVEGTGAGDVPSTWENTSYLHVGTHGSGTLEINDGGLVTNTLGTIAWYSGSDGTVTVHGTGSKWISTAGLYVGGSDAAAGGTGTLTVEAGGTVDVTGLLKVWGGGTLELLDSESQINTNALTVVTGGTFTHHDGTLTVNAGVFTPTTTSYAIDGAAPGDLPTVKLTNGASDGITGTLTVGNNYDGALEILGGGDVTTSGVSYIGKVATSTGTVTVDGAGSTWTKTASSSHLVVGYLGDGTLNITNGGFVENDTGYIADQVGSNGGVTVGDADSNWNCLGPLIVGNFGTGTLQINPGGSVQSTHGFIGLQAHSHGEVTVDGVTDAGARATWTNTGECRVGLGSYGNLEISNGGSVSVAIASIVGDTATATGEVTVSGVDSTSGYHSTWTNTGVLYVGSYGTGTVDIQSGGYVENTNCYIGTNTGSVGTVTVEGDGSTWTNNGGLTVGYYGIGTLDISDGGLVENTIGNIAYFGTSTSTVTVSGVDATSGLRSTWTNSGKIDVGVYGNGTLAITDGGAVSSNGGYISYFPGSQGTVTVEGTDAEGTPSTWTNSGVLHVGGYSDTGTGSATLDIIDGGRVENTAGYIGYQPGFSGAVTVDGDGSTWHNDNELYVGRFGSGTRTLSITGGGRVENTIGYIGYSSSTGTVTVDGAESTWDNRDVLYVGYGSTSSGTLLITGGGNVTNTVGSSVGYIACQTGSHGTVTVGGTGSTWDKNSSICVGGTWAAAGGTGVLTVETGGTVDAGAQFKLWSTGTLNLNGGTIRAAEFDWTAGTFNFNYGTLNYAQDLTIIPADALSQLLGPARTVSFAKHVRVDGTTTLNDILTLDGGTFSTGSLANPGLLQFTSGTFNLTSDNLTIGAGGLLGSTLALPSTKAVGVTNQTTVEASGELVLQGGVFSSGSLGNEGVIAGSGEIFAPLANGASGLVSVATGERQTYHETGNTNDGQIEILGGILKFTGDLGNRADGIIMGNGTLIARGGAYNAGTMAFSATTNVDGDLVNQSGGLVISAGGTTSFFDDVFNDGEIRTSQGSFSVFFGSLTGDGTFTGPGTVLVEGDLRPGSSPAAVSFAGNLALGDAATLVMELYGTAPGEFDVVDVADTLSLDGTLEVRLMDEFAPAPGNTFDILDWSTLGGMFDEVLLPGLASYLAWDTDDLYATGEIAVTYLTSPGDANLDGAVDDKDASILGAHWLQQSGATWAMGDFNLDGKVNDKDAAILAAHWGYGTGGGADVPEPSTMVLLGMGAVALLIGIRRRRPQAIIS